MHPDKNKAPQSEAAFKRVSKAYNILSDSSKRRHFDTFKGDPDAQEPTFQGFHDFETEIDPEMIFRAFFGQQFNQHFHSNRVFTQRIFRYQAEEPRQRNTSLLVPIILFFVALIFSQILSSGPNFPKFKFYPSLYYNTKHTGKNAVYEFYTDDYTWNKFKSNERNVKLFYSHVQQEFVRKTTAKCRLEINEKQQLFQRARGWGFFPRDEHLYQKAKEMKLKNCELLKKL